MQRRATLHREEGRKACPAPYACSTRQPTARIVAVGIIFGAVALAGQMMALVLKPTVHLLQLGVFDQLAGAIFGFCKAMVFIQIFLIVFVTYPKWDLDETIDGSFFGTLILENTAVLVNVLPGEFEGAVDAFTAHLSVRPSGPRP